MMIVIVMMMSLLMTIDGYSNDNDNGKIGDVDDENINVVDNQKKMESKSLFDFMIRVKWQWVSNVFLRSREEVVLSWEPNTAGVDFGMKKFYSKISFQCAITK